MDLIIMNSPPFQVLFIIYAVLNFLAFVVFGLDKLWAKVKIQRIHENILLLLAAFGPVGALVAVLGFRHKTRQRKFFLIPVFAILHVFLILLFLSRIG